MSEQTEKRDMRSKGKRIVFSLMALTIGLVTALIFAEAVSKIYFIIKDGRYVPVLTKLKNEKNAYIRNVSGEGKKCGYLDTLFPHPYLAFVHHGNGECGIKDINNIGLFGPDFPYEKDKDHFVILVTGGSVAAQFNYMNGNGRKYLQEILNEQYKNDKGKPFLVLNGGDGAWKYPQQIILFLLYADAIDAVVTLDGFNEHWLLQGDYRLEWPANNFNVVNPLVSGSYKGLLAVWICNKIYSGSVDSWMLSHSHFSYLITKSLRDVISRWGEGKLSLIQESKRTTLESIFALPEDWDVSKKCNYNISQYKKYIRMIDAVADKMKVRTAHFIQPVPAVGKVLTDDEKKVVGDLSYKNTYISMTEDLLKLNKEGIPVYSLLNVFNNTKDTVYEDTIHCNKNSDGESSGYKIMAERIAKDIAVTWKLKKK